MSYPTIRGRAVEGTPFREAQSTLGKIFANSTYKFFLSGASTPANVYQDGALTVPFPITGFVTSDNFGRFPAIYLDPSVIYRVQFFNSANVQKWQVDPYVSQLSTVGTSALSAFGFQIAPTGEAVMPAPNSGGSGITLTLKAGALGTTPLQISSTLPGNSALIVNNSATTGAQTATFTAANKPGTATSSPAGWLPITCDGVQYYTPIWHGNPFSPYVAAPSALGEMINAQSVLFGGSGLTTATGGTATPGNWFSPVSTGIGAGFWINITKTGGLSGLAFSAAQGAWTNIGAGGLTISSNAQAAINGTYQLSTSVTGSPVVANGTITLSNNNGVQSPGFINGAAPFVLAGNGTSTFNGVSTGFNWFAPTTPNIGSGFWISVAPAGGGTPGASFTGLSGVTNITNGGLSIGVTGPAGAITVNGTYSISSDSAGLQVLATGAITLTGGSNVQSPNWSGTTPLVLAGNGAATLNGVATSSWYSPNTANAGSGYWINITRTSGVTGVNFSAAQGSWTNITNAGLTIGMSGFTGDVGTVTVNGTYQISNSSSGTPVLGSGTVSLSVNAGTVIHVYTTPGSGTETNPTGTTTVREEVWGSGGGGGGGHSATGGGNNLGGTGGGAGFSYSQYTAAALGGAGKTFGYVVPTGGAAGLFGVDGSPGAAGSITAGTVTGFTAMTANGGTQGLHATSPSDGANGTGGTATGGNNTNTTGDSTGSGVGVTGKISGDGGPYGAAGFGGLDNVTVATAGQNGAAVFFYA